MMTEDIWAVTLRLEQGGRLEPRIAQIVEYLQTIYPTGTWLIAEIDGLGIEGGNLTQRCNTEGAFQISTHELLSALYEDGQIIELNAVLSVGKHSYCRLVVVDGKFVDVTGKGTIYPVTVLGPSETYGDEPWGF